MRLREAAGRVREARKTAIFTLREAAGRVREGTENRAGRVREAREENPYILHIAPRSCARRLARRRASLREASHVV